mgnify:FL=1
MDRKITGVVFIFFIQGIVTLNTRRNQQKLHLILCFIFKLNLLW